MSLPSSTVYPRIVHPLRRLAASLVLAVCATMLATPVGHVAAHASVVSVSPENASVLTTAPASVSITFNEPVSTDIKRVQLLSRTGAVVAAKLTVSGATLTLVPTRAMSAGAYVVRWSVTSADSHVVTGASSFLVGRQAGGTASTVRVAAGTESQALTFSSSRTGLVSVTVPTGTKALEFRHPKVGAAIPARLSGSTASVVLPMTGTWNITLVQWVSEFQERRLLGSVRIR